MKDAPKSIAFTADVSIIMGRSLIDLTLIIQVTKLKTGKLDFKAHGLSEWGGYEVPISFDVICTPDKERIRDEAKKLLSLL